jgi:hypothetical protein
MGASATSEDELAAPQLAELVVLVATTWVTATFDAGACAVSMLPRVHRQISRHAAKRLCSISVSNFMAVSPKE